ncbi:hypothetical protein [Vibrio crassostreae]|uniref:hypothetical protein n=1 Tax=Vibrio crassostreae TaxID=246167 RepID=UPI0010506BEF|nr:hypothetical protein [Vibrio crassostreae]TCV07215.1 hypothetical protein EDB16_11772 [Vibrio crassostreae]TWD59040.1 hypothetical protein FB444_11737 [Vibrio crassostreae]
MNNKYHRFTRLPKPIINKIAATLQLAEYYDALDVFRCLCDRTHHHSFQSHLAYHGELLGIQKRLNSKLKPFGYKLVSRQVPVGIQRAHKVSDKERRWGFEEMQPHEHEKHLKSSEAIKQLYELNKTCRKLGRKQRRAKKIKSIQDSNALALCLPLSKQEEIDLKEFITGTSNLNL